MEHSALPRSQQDICDDCGRAKPCICEMPDTSSVWEAPVDLDIELRNGTNLNVTATFYDAVELLLWHERGPDRARLIGRISVHGDAVETVRVEAGADWPPDQWPFTSGMLAKAVNQQRRQHHDEADDA